MTKFENLDLDKTYKVRVNKITSDKEYLHRVFVEGKTYKMRTSVYTHNAEYEWTTKFIYHHRNGFTQISEFDADLEIIEEVKFF